MAWPGTPINDDEWPGSPVSNTPAPTPRQAEQRLRQDNRQSFINRSRETIAEGRRQLEALRERVRRDPSFAEEARRQAHIITARFNNLAFQTNRLAEAENPARRPQRRETPRERTMGEELLRGVHRTAGAVAGGVGGLAGLITNPWSEALNQLGISEVVLGEPLSTDMGGDARRAIGTPEAETGLERIADLGAEGVVGGGPVQGIARGVAARVAPGVTQRVAQLVADAPGIEAIGGATSGIGQGLAAEAGAGPIGQTLAAVAGGLVGGTGAALASRARPRPATAAPEEVWPGRPVEEAPETFADGSPAEIRIGADSNALERRQFPGRRAEELDAPDDVNFRILPRTMTDADDSPIRFSIEDKDGNTIGWGTVDSTGKTRGQALAWDSRQMTDSNPVGARVNLTPGQRARLMQTVRDERGLEMREPQAGLERRTVDRRGGEQLGEDDTIRFPDGSEHDARIYTTEEMEQRLRDVPTPRTDPEIPPATPETPPPASPAPTPLDERIPTQASTRNSFRAASSVEKDDLGFDPDDPNVYIDPDSGEFVQLNFHPSRDTTTFSYDDPSTGMTVGGVFNIKTGEFKFSSGRPEAITSQAEQAVRAAYEKAIGSQLPNPRSKSLDPDDLSLQARETAEEAEMRALMDELGVSPSLQEDILNQDISNIPPEFIHNVQRFDTDHMVDILRRIEDGEQVSLEAELRRAKYSPEEIEKILEETRIELSDDAPSLSSSTPVTRQDDINRLIGDEARDPGDAADLNKRINQYRKLDQQHQAFLDANPMPENTRTKAYRDWNARDMEFRHAMDDLQLPEEILRDLIYGIEAARRLNAPETMTNDAIISRYLRNRPSSPSREGGEGEGRLVDNSDAADDFYRNATPEGEAPEDLADRLRRMDEERRNRPPPETPEDETPRGNIPPGGTPPRGPGRPLGGAGGAPGGGGGGRGSSSGGVGELARRASRQSAHLVGNTLNLPRSLQASLDLSAPFRQGLFMITRKEFWKNFSTMFRALGSERAYQQIMKDIENRPNYGLMKTAKLGFTELDYRLSAREEAFMSQWAEKIPVAGRAIRASSRAFTSFLNKLRADVFDDIVEKARQSGSDLTRNKKGLRDLGWFINNATGRGDLGKNLNRAVPMLNGLFFSPRLIASRVNLLWLPNYARLHPTVRKEAIKSLVATGTLAVTVMELMKAAGLEVEYDPRSSDFGKIKVGNTRYDILGGFGQYITLGARIRTNQTRNLSGEVRTLGEGFGQRTKLDVVEDFFENKASPVASFVLDYLRGANPVGEEFKLPDAAIQRLIPLYVQDIAEVVAEEGLKGAPMALPGAFGVGIQVIPPRHAYDNYGRLFNSVPRGREQDPTVREMERLSDTLGEGQSVINRPSRSFKIDGEKVDLTDEQYNEYQELAGQYIREDVAELTDTLEYEDMTDEERIEEIRKIARQAREDARNELFAGE